MSKSTAPQAAIRRAELPIAGRNMELRNFVRAAAEGGQSGPLATAQLVFTAGAAVRRYDWYRERAYNEVLVVEDGAIRLDRMRLGAPLLNSHSSWDLESQLGVVDNPQVADGRGHCDATFSRRDSVAGYVQDVADGIIRNVSVGYIRHRVEMVAPEEEGGIWTYRVIDWEPYEVSLVPIPADMDSQVVRSAASPDEQPQRALRTFPCEFIERADAQAIPAAAQQGGSETPAQAAQPCEIVTTRAAAHQPQEENRMKPEEQAGGAAQPQAAAPITATRAAPPADAQADNLLQRTAEISELCVRHGVAHLAPQLIRDGADVAAARAQILEAIAHRDAASGGHRNVGSVQTVRDEMETRMSGIEQAIMHRLNPRAELNDNGRQYRGMSLIEIGRDFLSAKGINTRGMSRMELAGAMLQYRDGGFMGASDLPNLFASVANKRLRGAYDENAGTYSMWARRAPNAPDFKSMNPIVLSGAPDLLKVNEHGEFKYGKMTDGKETYAVLTYGRIVSLTRQSIVNDDLRAFDRMATAFGFSARRLENRTVYAELTNNAALSDGVALFHATHANLQTGAGSALQASSLATGRTSMRTQKGLQSEELNIVPAYLIVPAALEQTAYQLTSANYVPATKGEINEFRAGGRTALTPVVEPILDAASATAWYLASDSGQIDTVEYCYLDGAEGPVIDSDIGFDVDGISYRCRDDFAAKAIDHRGLHKANGA